MPDVREGTPILEVIACSVADAIAAEKGGANRLEVVRDLKCGGLTPAPALVQEIASAVALPLRVMLRESLGYGVASAEEIDRLCAAAECFASLGIDGVVLGFLKNGEVDIDLTQRVLACAPRMRATFHHAFEEASNKSRALKEIKQLPQIDRILCSGGMDELEERVQRLDEYERAAAPELKILAGGGVDGEAIRRIGRATGITEFHVGRAVREYFQVEHEVQASLVSRLVELCKLSVAR